MQGLKKRDWRVTNQNVDIHPQYQDSYQQGF